MGYANRMIKYYKGVNMKTAGGHISGNLSQPVQYRIDTGIPPTYTTKKRPSL
jgi:hypothetical protein